MVPQSKFKKFRAGQIQTADQDYEGYTVTATELTHRGQGCSPPRKTQAKDYLVCCGNQ